MRGMHLKDQRDTNSLNRTVFGRVCLFAFGWFVFSTDASRLVAQSCPAVLPVHLSAIAHDSRGTIGIAVRHIERDELVELNGSQPLPMQSVFKIPIAMYILNEADHDRPRPRTAHVFSAAAPRTHRPDAGATHARPGNLVAGCRARQKTRPALLFP